MRKMYLILGIILTLSTSLYAEISRTGLTNIVQEIIPDASPNSGSSINYISIAKQVQYWIFALVGIIAVVYIVWAGAKLLWAPGNTEEI